METVIVILILILMLLIKAMIVIDHREYLGFCKKMEAYCSISTSGSTMVMTLLEVFMLMKEIKEMEISAVDSLLRKVRIYLYL